MPSITSKIEINKEIPIPLYYQLKKQVLSLIEQGFLKEGDMLPPENEISEALDISRPTVRQGLGELVAEGYLARFKGRGTFVIKPKVEARFLSKLESFNQEILQKGMTPSTKVIEMKKIEPKASINEALGIAVEQPLFYLSRLRYADGVPLVYLETYLPYNTFSKLMALDFTTASLYTALQDLYQLRVCRVSRELEALTVTRAEAELLETEPKQAMFLVKTLAYAAGYTLPVEYSIARYRGDLNKFKVELER